MSIRIILIDDDDRFHTIISDMLHHVEDITLVGQGYDGSEALQMCELYAPDVVLMDVMMRQVSGEAATGLIRAQFPDVKVMILSSFSDAELIYACLSKGAAGYVVKDVIAEELLPMIRTVNGGQTVLSPQVLEKLITPPSSEASQFGLTGREQEVLQLMAEGKGNIEVSEVLKISTSTVKYHVKNILHKLDSQTRSEALVMAAKHEVI